MSGHFDDDALRAAYEPALRDSTTTHGPDCPSESALLAAVRGEGSQAERLRVQAQIQAEETDRLRLAAEAEALARQEAETTLDTVAGQQANRLSAARQRELKLAREEAELDVVGCGIDIGNRSFFLHPTAVPPLHGFLKLWRRTLHEPP